jgi:hypothetical protein
MDGREEGLVFTRLPVARHSSFWGQWGRVVARLPATNGRHTLQAKARQQQQQQQLLNKAWTLLRLSAQLFNQLLELLCTHGFVYSILFTHALTSTLWLPATMWALSLMHLVAYGAMFHMS